MYKSATEMGTATDEFRQSGYFLTDQQSHLNALTLRACSILYVYMHDCDTLLCYCVVLLCYSTTAPLRYSTTTLLRYNTIALQHYSTIAHATI